MDKKIEILDRNQEFWYHKFCIKKLILIYNAYYTSICILKNLDFCKKVGHLPAKLFVLHSQQIQS